MHFPGKYSAHIRADKLDKLSVSIFLDSLTNTHGGVGANIAYSLALLGENPVLVGSVGPDADHYLERLTKTGVDTSMVHVSKLPTASFNVITDSDENQVGGFYPGAMFDAETLSFAPWEHDSPICLVGPHDPAGMRRQVAECVRWNLRLCYDVGQQVSNLSPEDLRAGVNAADVLILNEYEMAALSAKIGLDTAQIKAAVPVVVTTLGSEGSVIEGASIPSPVRAGIVAPIKVADPTGAGDAYRAGFLYGWRRQMDWVVCAQLGATCAAYAIENVGTQGHSFDLATVSGRYETTFGTL